MTKKIQRTRITRPPVHQNKYRHVFTAVTRKTAAKNVITRQYFIGQYYYIDIIRRNTTRSVKKSGGNDLFSVRWRLVLSCADSSVIDESRKSAWKENFPSRNKTLDRISREGVVRIEFFHERHTSFYPCHAVWLKSLFLIFVLPGASSLYCQPSGPVILNLYRRLMEMGVRVCDVIEY